MIETEELIRLRILENNVALLKRVMDHGPASDAQIRMIFDWPVPENKMIINNEGITIERTHSEIVPPPPKPLTSKKSEMMKKVKDLRVNHSMSGKQIAEKTGLSEATVSTYLKEMGLRNESSMTEISGPVPGAGK